MAGQPQNAFLHFDVTGLEILWEPGIAPANILTPATPFTLQRIGGFPGPGTEQDIFPLAVGTLIPGAGTYNVSQAIPGLPTPGIYRVGCTVVFPGHPGVLGFNQDLVIQVNALA
jgi:hypothetical protein